MNVLQGLSRVDTLYTQPPWFSQKLCCTQNHSLQTPCFTQKPCSCWASARAVCILQDNSFHGGRRNTPKAVKLIVSQWIIPSNSLRKFGTSKLGMVQMLTQTYSNPLFWLWNRFATPYLASPATAK